jgi:hypothetical protein
MSRAMGRESLEEAKAAAQRGSLASTHDGSNTLTNTAGKRSGSGSGTARAASGTASGATPRLGDGGGDDSSTVVSSSDASRRPARTGDVATSVAPESELEQYGEAPGASSCQLFLTCRTRFPRSVLPSHRAW